MCRGRRRVRRAAAGSDRGDGVEVGGEADHGGGEGPARAGLSRRSAGCGAPRPRGREDRLPRADQGDGRRRRQGHEGRRGRRRIRGCARLGAARSEIRVRRRAGAGREIPHRAAAHRDPGVRGHARQRRLSVRARLLRAAPAPEGAGGGAGARHEARASSRHGRGRRRGRARDRLRRRRHRRVHRRRHVRTGRHVLFHGDEHAAAGRASRHRDDHGPRSRRVAVPGCRGRAAAETAGRARDRRARDRGAHLRRGSRARLPAVDRHARASARTIHRPQCPRRHRRARRRRDLAVLRPDDREARRPRRGSTRGAAAPGRGARGLRDRRRRDQYRAAAADRRE